MDLQQLYNKAWLFACQAHLGQTMKASELPYAAHVAMVANELMFADRMESVGALEIALPAALLHDVVEDCGLDEQVLAEVFGRQVASTVASLSKNRVVPFSDERYLQGIARHSREAAAIKLCDRITNLQSAPGTWSQGKRSDYLSESGRILTVLGDSHRYLGQRLADTMARYKRCHVDTP